MREDANSRRGAGAEAPSRSAGGVRALTSVGSTKNRELKLAVRYLCIGIPHPFLHFYLTRRNSFHLALPPLAASQKRKL